MFFYIYFFFCMYAVDRAQMSSSSRIPSPPDNGVVVCFLSRSVSLIMVAGLQNLFSVLVGLWFRVGGFPGDGGCLPQAWWQDPQRQPQGEVHWSCFWMVYIWKDGYFGFACQCYFLIFFIDSSFLWLDECIYIHITSLIRSCQFCHIELLCVSKSFDFSLLLGHLETLNFAEQRYEPCNCHEISRSSSINVR